MTVHKRFGLCSGRHPSECSGQCWVCSRYCCIEFSQTPYHRMLHWGILAEFDSHSVLFWGRCKRVYTFKKLSFVKPRMQSLQTVQTGNNQLFDVRRHDAEFSAPWSYDTWCMENLVIILFTAASPCWCYTTQLHSHNTRSWDLVWILFSRLFTVLLMSLDFNMLVSQ